MDFCISTLNRPPSLDKKRRRRTVTEDIQYSNQMSPQYLFLWNVLVCHLGGRRKNFNKVNPRGDEGTYSDLPPWLVTTVEIRGWVEITSRLDRLNLLKLLWEIRCTDDSLLSQYWMSRTPLRSNMGGVRKDSTIPVLFQIPFPLVSPTRWVSEGGQQGSLGLRDSG